MKKRILLILSVLCAILLVSCSSTPEPEAPVESESVVQPEATPAPVQEPVKEEPAKSSQTADLMAKVLAARDMAIVAGANVTFADDFTAVDEQLEKLRANVEANPSNTDLLPAVQAKLDIYQAFEKICKALNAQERIISLDFIDYDKPSYEKGNNAVNTANDLFKKGDESKSAEILNNTDIALSSYNTVLTVAFKTLSDKERTSALAVKGQADEIKAGKASKDAYNAAQLQFSQADTFYVEQNYESSYDNFSKAHMNFQSLFDDVTKKRAAALAAMDKAKQKEAEVTKYAEEADDIAPLPVDDTTEAAQ